MFSAMTTCCRIEYKHGMVDDSKVVVKLIVVHPQCCLLCALAAPLPHCPVQLSSSIAAKVKGCLFHVDQVAWRSADYFKRVDVGMDSADLSAKIWSTWEALLKVEKADAVFVALADVFLDMFHKQVDVLDRDHLLYAFFISNGRLLEELTKGQGCRNE
eukprot:4789836-Amphidinium_carterae.1